MLPDRHGVAHRSVDRELPEHDLHRQLLPLPRPDPLRPPFGNQQVNVADQQNDPDSPLNWLRETLAVRRAHDGFGLGTFADLEGPEAVMAFQRQLGNARVVSLNNLTEWPQLARVTVPGRPAGPHSAVRQPVGGP